MRYVVSLVCVMAIVASPVTAKAQAGEEATTSKRASAALVVHGLLPPQLMLRASYYLYLDAGADTDATAAQTDPDTEEPKRAEADGQVATSGSNLEQPVSSPAPETEAPDVDTLSQRAIEHYEIQREESKKLERRRRRGLTIGVPIAAATVVGILVVVAVGASWDNSSD